MRGYDPMSVNTKYLFFTGKGGVGKTSVACATAVALADAGEKVLLISTDPASNLQDVFGMALGNKPTMIPDVPNLFVANLDPIQAAAEYRESVIAPYRGIMPESVIVNMEEQLSGSCTVEIAAFNEFTSFITDAAIQREYDYILFDTAPTGHTLRMLSLPSAWSGFISESTHGASCLGQLSGLESRRAMYKQAVQTLADGAQTTLVLVARPEESPLKEAERASGELSALGIRNQLLVINGILVSGDDAISSQLYENQQAALTAMPKALDEYPRYGIPLRAYNMTGLENIRAMLSDDEPSEDVCRALSAEVKHLSDVVDDIERKGRKVIFTMGKGGVGKTTAAAAAALALARRGHRVHLTTTDPAAHLKFVLDGADKITVVARLDSQNRAVASRETTDFAGGKVTLSRIDEQAELKKYQDEVLSKAKANGLSDDDIAYIEEDLRSPCTQEIAVFRAFAEIVEKADDQIVVIDTAPTGHTLLLLESTESYDREIQRTRGEAPESVRRLLPRLQSEETGVLIVTLPEATPVYESERLEADLNRAGLHQDWWIINRSFYGAQPENALLRAKAANEVEWIERVARHTDGKTALIAWQAEQVKGEKLLKL